MIKIFNIDMAIHFLEKNEDKRLFNCGLFQDSEELTHKDLDELRELKNGDYSYMYQYYTENLGGNRWCKYAELDVFEVEKDMFSKKQGWDSERDFLVTGYNSIIEKLNQKIESLNNNIKRLQDKNELLRKNNDKMSDFLENIATDFNNECPDNIKKIFEEKFEKFEDEYKCDFYILPDTKIGHKLADKISKRFFITHTTETMNGWFAIWSYGD